MIPSEWNCIKVVRSDSTTIDLCLSLLPWARFRQHKAAVKDAHAAGSARQYPHVYPHTDGQVHDVNVLDEILPEAGAFYVLDRGYIDFERYSYSLSARRFSCTHQREHLAAAARYSHPVDKTTGGDRITPSF